MVQLQDHASTNGQRVARNYYVPFSMIRESLPCEQIPPPLPHRLEAPFTSAKTLWQERIFESTLNTPRDLVDDNGITPESRFQYGRYGSATLSNQHRPGRDRACACLKRLQT